MSVHSIAKTARLYVRAELISAQITFGVAVKRAGMLLLAGALLILALVFLNIGLFYWLLPQWGPVWTPTGLGLINGAMAAFVFAMAVTLKAGPEQEFADELRQLSGDALDNEIKGGLGSGLYSQRAMQLLFPAISGIVGSMRRKKA